MQSLRTKIMGILNVTPDSFSDGGHYNSVEAAVQQAEKLIADGADILDVGGESTRPYAAPVSLDEELARTIPVIEGIRRISPVTISIDTTKAEVARQAIGAGADIINDVSALQKDAGMVAVAREYNVPVIIMHMQGTPADMQDNPEYSNLIGEIIDFLSARITWLGDQGIAKEKIIVDPGIGFGKTRQHNLMILKNLNRFRSLYTPLLLAHSRKNFLGQITGLEAEQRDLVSAVVAALAVGQGVDIVRVHDVAATRQALQVAEAIEAAD